MPADSPPFEAGFVVPGAGVSVMLAPKTRSRRVIERELLDVAKAQERATRALDFDAYQHLTEQINDLLDELAPYLPAQRKPIDP